jgi:hypothetical protein
LNIADDLVKAFNDGYKQGKIDAVVRGEWIHGCRDGAGTEFCYCSECNEDALKDKSGYTEFSAFCPSCGAKMDGEKEGV